MVHSAEDGSIPVPDMSALIARLEAAAGGSQALTDDTLRALGFVTKRYPMDSDRYWIVPGDERHPLPPWCDKITVSLDAALALAERVLPDHMRGPISLCIAGSAEAYIDHVDPCGDSVKAFGKTPALALCICILWAIQHGYEAEGEVTPILKAKAQGEGGQKKTPPCTAGFPEVAKQNWPEAQSSTPSGTKIRTDEPFTQAIPHDKICTPTTPPDGEGRHD